MGEKIGVKKSKAQRLLEAQIAYQKVLERTGLSKLKRDPSVNINDIPDYKITQRTKCGDQVGNGYKQDIRTDHLWKRDKAETPSTIREIERKAERVGVHFNKGGLSYITDMDVNDMTQGKLKRR